MKISSSKTLFPPDLSESALMLVGHGSTLNPDSSAPTRDHADAIRERGIFREVVSCFWKEEPGMREVFHMLASPTIYVVPNFISEGYFTRSVIPRELGLDFPVTRRAGATVFYCEPVGKHPHMLDVLLHRARETAPGIPPAESTLLIVGHGTGLDPNSARAAKERADAIAAMGIYGEVRAAYMEEPPLIAEWDSLSTFPNVVVVPFFIADGLHSYEDIPVLLGIESETGKAASQSEVFRQNPHSQRGKQLYYASAVGTDPILADVILEQVADFAAALALVNGEPWKLRGGETIASLLEELRIAPPTAIVEHNTLALARENWHNARVLPGDRIEILRVSAGG